MKVLFDTSVLVAAMIASHDKHANARPWLERARSGEFTWFVSAHTLAELYATLTAPVPILRVPPATAWRIIQENIEQSAQIVALTASDYFTAVRRMSELNLSSGAIYDALITAAAQKADVQCVLTFNPKHFMQVWPEGASLIVVP